MDSKKIKQALATIETDKLDSDSKNAYYAQKIAAVKSKMEKSFAQQNVISNVGLMSAVAVAVTGMATAYAMGNQSFALLAASGTLGVASSVVTAVAHKYNEIKINSQDKLLSALQAEQKAGDVSVSLSESHNNKFKQIVDAVKDVIYRHDLVAETIHSVISNAVKNNDHSTVEHVIKADLTAENNPRFTDYLARKSRDTTSFAFSIVETLKGYASSLEQTEERSKHDSIKNAVEAIHAIAESTQTTRWVNLDEFAAHYQALNQSGKVASFHVYPHDDSTVISAVPAYGGNVKALDGEQYNVVDAEHQYFDPHKHPQHIKDVVEHLSNALPKDNPINTKPVEKPYDGKMLLIELSTTRSAAFLDTGREEELVRILKEASEFVESKKILSAFDQKHLFDLNGNAVGTMKIVDALPNSSTASFRLAIPINSQIHRTIEHAAMKIQEGHKSFNDVNNRFSMVWASEPDLDYSFIRSTSKHNDDINSSMEL